MSHKLAVAVIHGIGKQEKNFADRIIKALKKRLARHTASDLVARPVHWADVIQNVEDQLWHKLQAGGKLRYPRIRKKFIDFAGDAIAYQPTPWDRRAYDYIHTVFAETLRTLAAEAGEKAPLCIIAHSLGTVIASNYIYDLQSGNVPERVSERIRNTPLERGETLTRLYTLGSPLAMWSMSYDDFGSPIAVPSPKLSEHHPGLEGGWINLYDKDDIIGSPVRTLNAAYAKAVKADRQVNVGGLLKSWNPAAHTEYWTDKDVVKPIAAGLAEMWRAVNP